ncbi:MAG TPA: G8 domain-containing protein, partial [Blastocatellia bacterium]|nr:G8 domain-containing protein [Blastocatellia bacterium]
MNRVKLFLEKRVGCKSRPNLARRIITRARVVRLSALASCFLVGIILWSPVTVKAATKTASVSGLWSSTTTWGGAAVPVDGDDVIINAGVTVTLGASSNNLNSLIVNGTITTSGNNRQLHVDFTGGSNLTINVGGTLTCASTGNPLTVTGNIQNDGTMDLAPGANNFNTTLSGTSSQTVSGTGATTFNNLTVSNTSAAISVTTNFDVEGILSVSASAVLNPSATVVVNSAAAQGTISGSGTVKVTRATGSDDFKGQYKFSTYTLTTLTVDYAGAAAQEVSAATYNKLTISNTSAAVTASSATGIAVSGGGAVMSIGAGATFSPGASVVINSAAAAGTISGSGTIQVTRITATADYSNQYKFSTNTLSSMTVDYAGAGNQSVNQITSGYGSLKTSGSGTKTFITGGSTVNSTLTVGANTTLDAVGFTTTVAGSLVVNGTLDFSANAGKFQTGASGTTTLTMAAAGLIRTVDLSGLGPGANLSLDTQGTGIWDTTSLNTAGTVEYYLGGAQTITARTYLNLKLNGSGTKTLATGTTTINTNGSLEMAGTAAFSVGSGTFTVTATGTTIIYSGSAAQTTAGEWVSNFQNAKLNNNNGTGVTLNAVKTINGSLTVGDVAANSIFNDGGFQVTSAGTLNLTSGTFKLGSAGTGTTFPAFGTTNISSGTTVEYTSGAAQTIAAVGYSNLTSSGAGARTLASSGTIGVGGTFTPGTNTYTITGSTINFTNSAAQTIPAFNYNNLTNTGNGNRTLASSGTIGIATTFSPGSGTYTVTGSTISYNGSAAQTGPTVVFTYNNLTLSNSAGLTLGATQTVNGVLDLGNGDIKTTTSFAINQNGTSAATATGDVVGSVQRTDLNVTGAHSFGNPNVQIAKTGGSASTVTVTLVKGATSLNIPSAVKREYNIDLGALTLVGSLRLHYLDSEVGTTAENSSPPDALCNLQLWRKDTTTNLWSQQGADTCSATDNWVQLSVVPAFSPWAIAGAGAPTACKLESFNASRSNNGVVLEWHTGLEVDNIGFNVYRETEAGKPVRLTPHLVAGSALMVRRGTMLTAGLGYSWTDPDTKAGDSPRYWLEDLDISGRSTWSGPFWIDENRKPSRSLSPLALQSPMINMVNSPPVNTVNSPVTNTVNSPTIDTVNSATINAANAQQLGTTAGTDAQYQATGQAELKAATVKLTGAPLIQQINLAGQPAVKISVRQEGYYRVNQTDLLAAGLDPSVDPRKLQLYVDGVQIPMIVRGESDGNFGPQDSIEFYGLGLDTASTDTHVYWLIAGAQPGNRIKPFKGASGAGSADSFPYTVQRKDRLYYFSNIPNGDKENFFGAFIYYQPTDQTLSVNHIAPAANATLEIAMQGFNVGKHHVAVSVNGALIGNLDFNDQAYSVSTLSFSQSLLTEGTNTVTMTAQAGNSDFSFVDYMKLTYSHSYNADGNALKFTAGPSRSVTVNGFSDPAIRVMDVTDPASPQEMLGRVSQTPQGYSVTTGTTGGAATRTLMVFLDAQ